MSAFARGHEAREPGEYREDGLERPQVPIMATGMLSPERPRPRVGRWLAGPGFGANPIVQVMSNFVEQHSSDSTIAKELKIRQWPLRQLVDNLVRDDLNPCRLAVPRQMVPPERRSASVLAHRA